MPHEPDARSSDPASRPASSREVLAPAFRADQLPFDSGPLKPPLALPKKRPLIFWIGIALLLGGLIALILVALSSD
ncbi:MAG TPA: hypothetical protein VK795_05895 [Terriglobales bacterium]|nr:hypothetical protein [Terriglobales bacterium]